MIFFFVVFGCEYWVLISDVKKDTRKSKYVLNNKRFIGNINLHKDVGYIYGFVVKTGKQSLIFLSSIFPRHTLLLSQS